MGLLAAAYLDSGKLDQALLLLEEDYPAAKKHAKLHWVGTNLYEGYVQAGKTAQAATLAKELLSDARLQLPKDSPEFAQQMAITCRSLLQAKAFADAEPLLRECLAIREKQEKPDEAA